MTDAEERARTVAFSAMLSIVNEWHRQVGIDEVMKTKLTRAIADTIAERAITSELTQALREAAAEARAEENEACAGIAINRLAYNLAKEIASRMDKEG